MNVGAGSSGTLALSGSATANLGANELVLGSSVNGHGAVAVNGSAALTAGDTLVGLNGAGTVVQTGGTINVHSALYLGCQPGASGTVTVSGGTLASTRGAVIGQGGAGTLNVSGGTCTLTGASVLLAEDSTGSAGTLNLTGGILQAQAVLGGAGTGTVDFGGGTLQAAGNAAAFLQGLTAATVGTGGATIDTQAYAVTVAQPLSHLSSLGSTADGGLTKVGTGTLTLSGANAYTGPTTVSAGTLTFAAAESAGTLTIVAGAAVTVAPTARSPTLLSVAGLTVGGGGRLDLTDDALDVRNGSLSAVTALAAAGYAGGTWAGPGLTSGTAAADAARLTAVGVIQNATTAGGSTPIYTGFDGRSVSAADVLSRYTYYGDANLDGVVNGADYARIDAGYLGHLTGWANGDFNYDGKVDGSDYTLIDNAFNRQAGSLANPAALTAEPTALVASPAVDAAGSTVP